MILFVIIAIFILLTVWPFRSKGQNDLLIESKQNKIALNSENELTDDIQIDEEGREFRTKIHKEKVERRTYINGNFIGKYWGEFYNAGKVSDSIHKHFYFKIYEAKIFISNRDQISTAPFFINNPVVVDSENLPDKYLLEIYENNNSNIYSIELYDVKFEYFVFSPDLHQTENKEVFGTVGAQIYGYIRDFVVIEKQERIYLDKETPLAFKELSLTNIPTGNIEEKDGYESIEYYYSDFETTGWGSWNRNNNPVRRSESYISREGIWAGCLSLLSYIILIILIGNFIFSIGTGLSYLIPLIAIFGGVYLLSKYIKLIALIFGAVFMLIAVGFLFHQIQYPGATKIIERIEDNGESAIIEIDKITLMEEDISDVPTDSTIYRFRKWKDLKGCIYEGRYSVLLSDYIESRKHKFSIVLPSVTNSYDYLLYNLKESDKGKLNGLYAMFDSIQSKNNLSQSKFAEMIMGFVQDIPYYSVLPNECDPRLYNDNFLRQYLSTDTALCDPNEPFGINTPLEFITTLKGDCDTRTLLLYLIYSHYNYDVALLSSNVFNHSMIGINLNYSGFYYPNNGNRYYFWETTSVGNYPGITDPELARWQNWRISLKSK